jgi:hypothetical protein
LYLLISRFGLLAGTVAEGVDPTTQAWGLNATGWTLIGLPFVLLLVGTVIGVLRRSAQHDAAIRDLVT